MSVVFVIDGREYPAPDLDTLTMGERRVLFDLSGIVQEDLAPLEDETAEQFDERSRQMRRHPGFMQALMHIGYQRGNPEVKRDRVAEIIESTNYIEAITAWADSVRGADDPVPLAQTSSPDVPSSRLTGDGHDSIGASSLNGLDERAVSLLRTGTGR